MSRATTKSSRKPAAQTTSVLAKCPTGIRGFDDVTLGGLPKGRASLICGEAGCGKTLFGIEFLVRGARDYNEPGVCLSFEETAEELTTNVACLGFELDKLVAEKKIAIDHIYTERSLIEETGEYDLEGLFLRLAQAANSIKATRVLIDSIESLFAGFANEAILRAELRRLFRWLKDHNLTALITAERGDRALTRYGIEEYISDCVIVLDNRVHEGITTRRLRVMKYRGSSHGTNEYPFLIDKEGISVLPITSLELRHEASNERVSTGLADLDAMLGGEGYYRGSSILISGTAGTGKTTFTSHLVDAACRRGERCIVFSFEESPAQIARNMRSIGMDLNQWVKQGLLRFHTARPTTFGLEMHLVKMHQLIMETKPSIVVVDPVTALLHAGTSLETRSMLLRLVDFLKGGHITAVMTTLTSNPDADEQSEVGISSVVDCWILLRDIESGGERNRGIYVLKSRGLPNSNQIREYVITANGIRFRERYAGNELLTGAARAAREALEASKALHVKEEIRKKHESLRRRKRLLESKIAGLQSELDADDGELQQLISSEQPGHGIMAATMEEGRTVRAKRPTSLEMASAAGPATSASPQWSQQAATRGIRTRPKETLKPEKTPGGPKR